MSTLVAEHQGLWERVKSLFTPAHIARHADEADAQMAQLTRAAAEAHLATTRTIRAAQREIANRLDGR